MKKEKRQRLKQLANAVTRCSNAFSRSNNMSHFNEEEFREGIVSKLVLFDLPATQTSVSDAYYEETRALFQVSSEGPFEFAVVNIFANISGQQ